MKRVEPIFIYAFAVILLGPLSTSANRGMINIGPKEVNIQESVQNAIVAWNGDEEVIILSTDVQSSRPTLVLEALPLPSNSVKVEEGSFDSFQKLTAKNNEQIRAISEKAKELFRKGLDAESLSDKEAYYIESLKLRPGYAEAHNNLGDVYEKQGRYQDAITEYQIASVLAPNAFPPYFGLGDVYFKLGRFPTAIVNYEKGLKIEPDDKVSIERLKLSRILTTKIVFPFDSCQLTEKATEQLELVARSLSENTSLQKIRPFKIEAG